MTGRRPGPPPLSPPAPREYESERAAPAPPRVRERIIEREAPRERERVIERERVEQRVCGCGRCGLTFSVVLGRKTSRRKYAESCPGQIERAREKRRVYSQRAYERNQQSRPRFCLCGCGRALPRYVRFHPECPTQSDKPDRRYLVRETNGKRGRCRGCWDQPWRRDPTWGCPRCKGAYEPEARKRREVPMGSALGYLSP